MGKRKKKLAVLLATTMAMSLMTSFTSFAAEGQETTGEQVQETTLQPGGTEGETSVQEDSVNKEPLVTITVAPSSEENESGMLTETKIAGDEDKTDVSTNDVIDDGSQDTGESETPEKDTSLVNPGEVTDLTAAYSSTPESEEPVTSATSAPSLASAPTPTNNNTDEEETETKTTVWLKGEELKESEDFVSLGENKGSYKYNDGTLVLKDVVIEVEAGHGPAISFRGTLVIDLQGNNTLITNGGTVVTGWFDSESDDNKLTITGDEDASLLISNKGEGKTEDSYYSDGIYVGDGDLVIDGVEVTSDVYSSGYSAAIWVDNGDVTITNGADVTAKSEAVEDVMCHYGIYAGEGKISVTNDSDVYASADGDLSDLAELVAAGYGDTIQGGGISNYYWYDLLLSSMFNGAYGGLHEGAMAQLGIGMFSEAYGVDPNADETGTTGILIDDSNVRSIGSFASMLVIGQDGTIKINDSTIISPDDVNIRELMAVIDDDPDAAAVIIGAILANGEGPIDIDAIMKEINKLQNAGETEELETYLTSLFDAVAKDVNIVRDAELQIQKAGLVIPKTGVEIQVEGLVIALIMAGAICAYCIRRKVTG